MENPFVAGIVQQVAERTTLSPEVVRKALTVPPSDEMGDYAFPCFAAAKALRKSPAQIAADLAVDIPCGENLSRVEAAGPYVNFFVEREKYLSWMLKRVLCEKDGYGHTDVGKGRTVVVEFSSPNIAKHLGIHHIRSTMIGNALAMIHRALGYDVVAINFLGDWGTQFGILIAAYKRWGDEAMLQNDPVTNLNKLYVRFNKEAESDPALRDEGRAWFKKLEAGDNEAVTMWNRFRDLSLQAYNDVYRTLGVQFDRISGESEYDKIMPATIARLESMGLAKMDQGALIVDLSKDKMPPVLLRKSDGATLYHTRDIAAAEDRYDTYQFARMIYVVGADQKLHFRQIFKVLDMMGYEWAANCVHVDFGILRLRNEEGISEKMATRRGTMIMLKDVLDEAVERVRQAIREKNPDLKDAESIAHAVGVGAVVFNDLKRQRIKDVDFDWDSVLSFEGETGPYVQYAHVRLCSILRKYAKAVSQDVDFSLLTQPEEFSLARRLDNFGDVIRRAADACEPSVIVQYLLDLCSGFSNYYHKHQVVGEDRALTDARVLLVDAVRQTIANGLTLLGIEAPQEM